MINIDPLLKNAFKQADCFSEMMSLRGEVFRELENRRTSRIVLLGKTYFIKQHFGIGWKEIFKNIFQVRLPVISAKNEWRANQLLKQHNIPVVKVLAYGEQGYNPARKKSFILSAELQNCDSLEDLANTWKNNLEKLGFLFKTNLIKKIADTTSRMHLAGINHRDYYLCHLWLERTTHELYVMDLHRAQIRNKVPKRWLIKDLAGLYFSAMDAGLSRNDYFRFLKYYFNLPLRLVLDQQQSFLQQVAVRAQRLYYKTFSKMPRQI